MLAVTGDTQTLAPVRWRDPHPFGAGSRIPVGSCARSRRRDDLRTGRDHMLHASAYASP
jgi:hypothetical protein